MKISLALAAAARVALPSVALVVAGSVAARADEPIVYKFSFASPPTSWINTQGITPWTEEVAKASGGTLKINVFAGGTLANARNVYDRVINGVAEFGYNAFADTDQFPGLDVSAIPFEADDNVASTKALWHMVEKGIITDFSRVKPIAVFNIPGNGLNSNKPITKLEDMDGLKVSVAGKVVGEAVTAVGGTPLSLISSELYPSMQRGMIQVMATSFLAIVTFKLDEVTKYHLDVPFGQTPAGYFMNKEAYTKLPEKDRKAIDSTAGEKLSLTVANAGKGQLVDAIKKLSTPPHSMHKLDAAEYARWKQRLAPIVEEWTKRTPNGAAILAAYRQELAAASTH
jgi:TRAP-type C4-dicarboxylate transport system substrate-binding protein